jgi:hypothetical protein
LANFEESLFSALTNDAGVSALVSARVYPMSLPQKPTYPAISYQVIADEEHPAMSVNVDTRTVRVQVSCWATSYSGVKSLANAVKSALDRRTGTTASVLWKCSFKESEVDIFEPEVGEKGIFQKAQDYRVSYN